MNRSSVIAGALRRAGIDAFLPGEHEGICTRPYAVVRQLSGVASGGRGHASYRVILLVPQDSPGQLDGFAEDVRRALLPLRSHGIYVSQPRGAVLTDDLFRAVTTYIDYISYFSDFTEQETDI